MPLTSARRVQYALPLTSALLLVLVLTGMFYALSSVLVTRVAGHPDLEAKAGSLSIPASAFENNDTIPLSGEWQFYWGQLISPEDGTPDPLNMMGYIDTPHSWERTLVDGNAIPNQGMATYILDVELPEANTEYGLLLPLIGTSYRLFVDNEYLASGGQVGTSRKESVPFYNSTVVTFTPERKQVRIWLQVANFDYFWGGVWQPLQIGKKQDVYLAHSKRLVRTAVIVACFVTIALFNLIHFSLRAKDLAPFIVSISCLMLAAREIEASQILTQLDIFTASWATNAKINFLTFYLSVPIMTSYFQLSFYRDFHPWVMRTIYTFGIGFSLIVILTEPLIFSYTMQYFQWIAIVIMVYMIWRLILVAKRRRTGAWLILMGSLLLFVLTINDILFNMGIVETGHTASFGLLAFVLCQSYVTYMRFIAAKEENVKLYSKLEQRNRELQEFSHSLEEKVNLRTKELAQANQRLEELAHQDPLTGLLNRRGLMAFLEDATVQQWQVTSMSLLVIDFDHFKALNDTHGHEAGDNVLASGAKLMQEVVRELDLVARWGGEEFTIVLPGTPLDGAKILAEKLRAMISDKLTEQFSFTVTVTIGAAQFKPDESFAECFKRADEALFEGKEKGRNLVVVAQ